MKKIIASFFALMLIACAPKYERSEIVQEQLNAFLFTDNKLYVIGEKNDYELDATYLKPLQDFLLSKYSGNLLYGDIKFDVKNNNEVHALYRVYLDANTLKSHDIKVITEQYRVAQNKKTLSEQEIRQIRQTRPKWVAHNNLLTRNYVASGNIVRLPQRDDLLRKHRLKAPVIAEVRTNIYRQTLNVSAIFLPVTVIPMALTFGIIGLAAEESK